MMNGASTLEGYVPDVDATVVTRILDAGGTIVGKAVCEYFCFSGGSHTSLARAGPQPAPHGLLGRRLVVGQRRRGRAGRGAAWRSAATRAARSACRRPIAASTGMKPTHGLVPYTGIMPIELTIDHTGPMTATVEDNALLLEVLAGPDGLDPRQYGLQAPSATPRRWAGARRGCGSAW